MIFPQAHSADLMMLHIKYEMQRQVTSQTIEAFFGVSSYCLEKVL